MINPWPDIVRYAMKLGRERTKDVGVRKKEEDFVLFRLGHEPSAIKDACHRFYSHSWGREKQIERESSEGIDLCKGLEQSVSRAKSL